MTLVGVLYGRVRHLVHEVTKFGIVGGLCYVVTVLVDEACLRIRPHDHLTAYILGNVVATGVAYLGNRHWTYKGRDTAHSAREMGLFAAINGVAIAIQAGVVALTFYLLDLRSHLENFFSEFVLAIAVGMAFRFWCYRSFIFPEAEPTPASGEFPYSGPLPGGPLPSTPLAHEVPLTGSGTAALTVEGR